MKKFDSLPERDKDKFLSRAREIIQKGMSPTLDSEEILAEKIYNSVEKNKKNENNH